jgi:hypothetical protein
MQPIGSNPHGVGALPGTVPGKISGIAVPGAFYPASVSCQQRACLETMGELSTLLSASGFPSSIPVSLEFFERWIAAPIETPRDLEQRLTLIVGLLDTFVLDQMACSGRDQIYRHYYGRMEGQILAHCKRLAMTPEEYALFLATLDERKWKRVDGLPEIGDAPLETLFYLKPAIRFDELSATLAGLKQISPGRSQPAQLVVSAGMGEVMLVTLYGYAPLNFPGGHGSGRWEIMDADQLVQPLSALPRQEFWKALLTSGFAVLPSEKGKSYKTTTGEPGGSLDSLLQGLRTMMPLTPEYRPERTAMRRLSVLIRNAGQEAVLGRLEDAHIRHYESLLSEGRDRPLVRLTRSGVSANETAIRLARTIAGPDARAYLHPGWYYENAASVDRVFSIVGIPEEANVLFLSLLPCVPEALMRKGAISQDRASLWMPELEALQRFLRRARRKRHEPHVLVLDKTSNLLFSVNADAGSIPRNLTVIETASLTKHQRGAKNYFFGLIAVRGKPALRDILDTALAKEYSRLTPFGLVHLPRLTTSEISRQRAHLEALNKTFGEAFDSTQEGLPVPLASRVEVHGPFVYLLPHMDSLTEQFERALYRGVPIDRNFLEDASTTFLRLRQREGSPFRGMTIEAQRAYEAMGIFCADSFGLKETRILSISAPLWKRMTTDRGEERRGVLEYHVLRVAAGTSETEETIRRKGRELGLYLAKQMQALFHHPRLQASSSDA